MLQSPPAVCLLYLLCSLCVYSASVPIVLDNHLAALPSASWQVFCFAAAGSFLPWDGPALLRSLRICGGSWGFARTICHADGKKKRGLQHYSPPFDKLCLQGENLKSVVGWTWRIPKLPRRGKGVVKRSILPPWKVDDTSEDVLRLGGPMKILV